MSSFLCWVLLRKFEVSSPLYYVCVEENGCLLEIVTVPERKVDILPTAQPAHSSAASGYSSDTDLWSSKPFTALKDRFLQVSWFYCLGFEKHLYALYCMQLCCMFFNLTECMCLSFFTLVHRVQMAKHVNYTSLFTQHSVCIKLLSYYTIYFSPYGGSLIVLALSCQTLVWYAS